MEKLYFLPTYKLNHSTIDTVIPGSHIRVGDYYYEQLSRRPRNRRVKQSLLSMDEKTQILIFN